MLLKIMKEIRNAFTVKALTGNFVIHDGILQLEDNIFPIGSHLIIDRFSILNSGVYEVKDDLITIHDSRNESWSGTIYLSVLPKDFLLLVQEIQDFKNETNKISGIFQSESFGEYSYTLSSDKGSIVTWQSKFAKRLDCYRKMFLKVKL